MAYTFQISIDPSSQFAKRISDERFSAAPIVEVPRLNPPMAVSQCFMNVRLQIAEKGGTHRIGWMLSLWPARFIEATHHAVWVDPAGQAVDVTGKPFVYMKGDKTTFIEAVDQTLPEKTALPSEFVQLDNDPLTARYIYCTQQKMILAKDLDPAAAALRAEAEGLREGFAANDHLRYEGNRSRPCRCGSGLKYKHCHGLLDRTWGQNIE